jgi:hypothetical protein
MHFVISRVFSHRVVVTSPSPRNSWIADRLTGRGQPPPERVPRVVEANGTQATPGVLTRANSAYV